MKRNLVAFFAVVAAIAFSAYTVRVDQTYYLVYDQSLMGVEKDINSYITPYQTTQPSHVNPGTGKLNWFRVVDIGANGISTTEFNNSFDAVDTRFPSLDLLSDETADKPGQLDVMP